MNFEVTSDAHNDSVVAWVLAAVAEKLKDKNFTKAEIRRQRIAVLRELAELLAEEESDAAGVAGPDEDAVADNLVASTEFKERLVRSPLTEAVLTHLAASKDPQKPKQIAVALLDAGREFETSRPVIAVRSALRKLLTQNPDVDHVAWARWFLRSKMSKAKLAKIKGDKSGFGTGGRSKAEHIERTKAGLAALKEQGGKLGAPLKATPEMIEHAKDMLREGVPLKEVCKSLNVSISLLYLNGVKARQLRKEAEERKQSAEPATEADNVVQFSKGA